MQLVLLLLVLAPAVADWSCMRVNSAIDAFRLNADGDVECGSLDGRSCNWVKTSSKCDSSPSDALACGAMHKKLYGITGYDDPSHWCYKVRLVLSPVTDTPVTDAPTTLAPTTLAPTTLAPTTLAPTTLAPTTVAPTTVAPTTVAPRPTTAMPSKAPATPSATVATTAPTSLDVEPSSNGSTTEAPRPTTSTVLQPADATSTSSGVMGTVGYLVLALGALVCVGAIAFFLLRRRKKHKEQLDSLMWAETHKSLHQIDAKAQVAEGYYSQEPAKPPPPSGTFSARVTEQSCDIEDGFDAYMPAFDTIYSNENSSFLVQAAKADADLLEELELWRLDGALLTLTEQLASSQDKEVWRGVYDDEVVAVKSLKVHSMENATAKFVHEIQILMKLDCPNIVAMYGVIYSPENVSESVQLVYEFMDNGNLAQYLARTPVHEMHWTEKVRYAIDIVIGLQYLHARGIIHRDLKCKHVLVNSNMQVKLTDFNGSRETDVFMTQGAGTLRWTAPEVYTGSSYTVAADIYSLGMIFVELETHLTPFAKEVTSKGRPLNDFEIMQRVQDQSLVPHFPAESPFREMGLQCVAWDPQLRPTPDEIITALENELQRATMSF
ncbi:TKL protein kinase [Saprolegnia diclina VS20]|uniref:TKL protein kinase n=1 Tax=Saprolegnia diclina (strain VS20) TaxID=1156394 RepID=T0R862_SAPDV|nr:TKL protein kinase [Saprolegnia diclina VS20]EQC28268.1 TKL protein kinase [Saprolegnia diclina VS20]|eukprot:XP_008618272.1 TKL protein kinase [Saprolegnia diclina VS20]